MPSKTIIDNDFSNGLITEATGLNFPDKAATETYDCEFTRLGSVKRRFGFDFEIGYATKTIDRTNRAISTYLWKNVSGDGNVTVVVMQVGSTLYFYETGHTGNYSGGAVSSTVTLTPVSGATATQVSTIEAQYSDGNGYLVVTHPCCDPIRVSYDTSTDTADGTSLTLKIRDFQGATEDPNGITDRPTATLAALNVAHKYNLYNQGWTTANLTAWDTAQTTMPSNADVMWAFKDSSNNFAADNTTIARVVAGNTPAAKGHFILTLSNQDRDTASGLSGVVPTTTGTQRPSTSAFFAGRVFYAGINYSGFNSKLFFTQILERPEQYAQCYQVNDPTSEDLFDILPSDGGVIQIPDGGTILKLMTVPGGLCAFCTNGVWFITGSTGIGFTAVDYTVQKIALIETLTATSFVSVQGYPVWWNAEGIYMMTPSGQQQNTGINFPQIQSLTNGKIRTFYDNISLSSKRIARGFYHPLDGHIRWVYRSEATVQVTEVYEFDRVLSFNTLTGAFYPWTISDSDVKVNSIIPTDLLSSAISTENVVDGSAVLVVDGSAVQVIAFTDAGTTEPFFDKYLVSYPSGGSYKFTFADKMDADFLDWSTYDGVGVGYTSYLITGFKFPPFSNEVGGIGTRFQNNWVRIYSQVNEEDSLSYYFQGIWDYATTGSGTGRWSSRQLVEHDTANYSTVTARLKVRGHGLALQFRIESVPNVDFHIAGWSALQTANMRP